MPVESKMNSSMGRGRPRETCAALGGEVGWTNTTGVPPVEFGVQRAVAGVAEVDACGVGLDGDAVAAQVVEGEGEFAQ